MLSGAGEVESVARELGRVPPNAFPILPSLSPTRPPGRRRARGLLPGDLVRAGHGDELLTQQDAVPRLYRARAPDGDGPFPRLDLRAQVPAELPDDVLPAVH